MFTDLSECDTDISYISSDRPSTDSRSMDPMGGMLYDGQDSCRNSRVSTSSESSFGSMRSGARFSELSSFTDFSTSSVENVRTFSLIKVRKLVFFSPVNYPYFGPGPVDFHKLKIVM